jgi:type II secretory pathway component GspD/PulD (secretin)
MKNLIAFGVLLVILSACTSIPAPKLPQRQTLSSFHVPSGTNATRNIPAGMVNFREVELSQMLEFYQDISRRTVLCAPNVTRHMKFTFRNEQPLNRIELLRLLDDALAQYGATTVYQGDDVVKVVPSGEAVREVPPEIDLPANLLPDSSSYMQRSVKLHYVNAQDAQGIVAPFTRLPNSVIATKGAKVLILRDYAANIRRMLSVLETVDTPAWKNSVTPARDARSPRPATAPAR